VSAIPSSASTAFPVAAHQSTTSLTPPAVSQAILTLGLLAVAATVSDDDKKLAQWRALASKFDEICMQKHKWQYNTDYTPVYHFQQVTHICDLWTEWSMGLNGFLPVRNLDEGWGARWWQGNWGQGTENC